MRQRETERDRVRQRETGREKERDRERVEYRADFMIKLFEKYQGRSSKRK